MQKMTRFLISAFSAAIVLAIIPMSQTVHQVSACPKNGANSASGACAVILGGNGFAFTPTFNPRAAAGHGFAGACTNLHGCVNPPHDKITTP
jgi:hypothetical protein